MALAVDPGLRIDLRADVMSDEVLRAAASPSVIDRDPGRISETGDTADGLEEISSSFLECIDCMIDGLCC